MHMFVSKGYKNRIYPNRTQVNRIDNIFGFCTGSVRAATLCMTGI